jgi:hypothetical protein
MDWAEASALVAGARTADIAPDLALALSTQAFTDRVLDALLGAERGR